MQPNPKSRHIHTTVMYHANCPDGAAAALGAYKRLGSRGVQYLAQSYHKHTIPQHLGKNLYILDFSFPLAMMEQFAKRVDKLVLLDHHKTAQDELGQWSCPCGHIHIDLSKSGARLAWEYFHPETRVPRLIEYVEDRDLWKWSVPNSKEFLAAVDIAGFYKFRNLEPFLGQFDGTNWVLDTSVENALIQKGRHFQEKVDAMVQAIALSAFEVRLMGHKVWAANCPPNLVSEVGAVLAQRSGNFAICFRVEGDGVVKCSLRAIEGVDVEPIAKQFGGGGHPQACSFSLTLEQLSTLLRQGLSL